MVGESGNSRELRTYRVPLKLELCPDVCQGQFTLILQRRLENLIMYLTYLQENFKPVVYRSASVEVFDEEDAQVVHPRPSYWGCQGT